MNNKLIFVAVLLAVATFGIQAMNRTQTYSKNANAARTSAAQTTARPAQAQTAARRTTTTQQNAAQKRVQSGKRTNTAFF